MKNVIMIKKDPKSGVFIINKCNKLLNIQEKTLNDSNYLLKKFNLERLKMVLSC